MKKIRFLLYPLAILYDVVTSIRNFFFDYGIFKEQKFDIPVITVGNLSVGGTGKTPQIEYLVRLLQGAYKVAVLSRGYRRKTKGFILVNSKHTANDVGDEPLQYFKKFQNITVAVDTDRVNGIQQLQQGVNPAIILLDDAYQHRNVKAGFSILLTKYKDLFVNDFLLPTGNLRESKKGAKRTDIILVTKCPENLTTTAQLSIKNKLSRYQKPVFFTSISYAATLKGANKLQVKDLKNYRILLVTGIANPKPMLNFLGEKEIHFTHLKYSDHHHFSEQEIKEIQDTFDAIDDKEKVILTTEKDYMRLHSRLKQVSYLPIVTYVIANQLNFDNVITDYVKQNQ